MKTWKFIIALFAVAAIIGIGPVPGTVCSQVTGDLTDVCNPLSPNYNPDDPICSAAASVCGIVTDGTNNPLIGLWINVWSDKLGQGSGAETGERGAFCVKVPQGPGYDINIGGKPESDFVGGYFKDDDGKAPWKGRITADWNVRTLIEVGSQGVSGIAVILKKGVTVSGVVLDDKGNPVPHAWVKAHSDITGSGNGVSADEKGNFKIPVAPGKGYKIAVAPEAIGGLAGGIFKDADGVAPWEGGVVSDWEPGTPLDVGDTGLAGIKIRLKAGIRIFGKVVMPDVSLAKALWVEAHSEMGGGNGSPVAEDGSFSISVAAGKGYVVSLWPPPETGFVGGFWRGKINADGTIGPDGVLIQNREEATFIDILDKDRQVNISLVKGNTISGRVTDEGGNGVPGLKVAVYSQKTEMLRFAAGTDDQGYYEIPVSPAPDYIAVVYGDGRYQTQFYKGALTPETATPIDASQASVGEIDFVFKTGDCMAGTVTGLNIGEYAFIGAWSDTLTAGNGIDMKGTGEPAEFKICGLVPGDDYRIEVRAGNYQSGFLQADGSLGTIEQAARYLSDKRDLKITLAAGRCISGAVSGVAEGDRLWLNAVSESAGSWNEIEVLAKAAQVEFKLCGLAPAKDFRLGIHSEHYQKGFYGGPGTEPVPWDMAALIDTTAGDVTGISIKMSKGRKISGTVTGLSANEHAWIQAFSENTGSCGGTDVMGTGTGEAVPYEIAGLGTAGDFRVSVHSKLYMGGFYTGGAIVQDPEQALLVSTKEGDASGIDFALSQGKSISGTVSGLAEGERAWIEASSPTGGWGGIEVVGTADAAASVAYEIVGLGEAADFTVCFRPMRYVHECKEGIAAGASDVNFTVSEGSSISGKITGAPALSHLWVDAWSKNGRGGNGIGVQTDEAGSASYEISGLPPANDYIVSVHTKEKHLFYKNTALWEEAEPVDISAGSKTGIDFLFAAEKFYVLSGTIAGLPDDNRFVGIDAWDETTGAYGATRRHGNGEFSLELPEGNYFVAFRAAGYSDMLYSTSGLTIDWDAASKVAMTADKALGELKFTGDDLGFTISGTVTSNSKAQAGVAVEFSNPDGLVFTTVTNRSGFYKLKGIPAATYSVKAANRFGSFEGEVEVTEDKSFDIALVVTGTGGLKGRLTFGGVAPAVGGVSVKLVSAGKLIMAETDAEGNYEFSGLKAGEYKVNAVGFDEEGNPLGGIITGKTVTITAGGTATLNLEG